MMKKHIFRAAALSAALAGISLLASCGSGLLDTKDDDWTYNILDVTGATLSGSYGMAGDAATLTVTLYNGTFSDELTTAIEDAASTNVDISEYFDIKLVSDSDTHYALLRSSTLMATSAVSDVYADLTDKAYKESAYQFTAKLSYKLTSDHTDETATGTVQISANANALSSGVAQRSITTGRYTFEIGEYQLLAPTCAFLTEARNFIDGGTVSALSTGLSAAARISLPVPASVEIAAGTQIATATVGSLTDVKVYTAADSEEEAGVLYVIFNSESATASTFSGSITAWTFDTTYASIPDDSTLVGNDTAVAANLWVPYYGQDFESGTTDWTLINSVNSAYHGCKADDSTSNANTSSYIYGVGGREGDTGTQVAVSSAIDGTVVEFDLKFDGVYTNKGSSFALLGAANTKNWLESDYEILTFAAGTGSTAGYIDSFTINGTDYLTACSVSTDGSEITTGFGQTLKRGSTGWLHGKAVLDFTNHTMDLVVTKVATGAVVCEVSDLAFMDGSSASALTNIFAAAGKTYGGVWMDNFGVYIPGTSE